MSGPTYAQSEQVWDPRLNAYIEQLTVRDFTGNFSPPSGAMEYSVRVGDAERRHTWRQYADGSGFGSGTPSAAPSDPGVIAHGICQPQPIIDNALFQPEGTYALSDDDKTKIQRAEGDLVQWIKLSKSSSAALAFYAKKRLRGQESYLLPSVTLQATSDEGVIPDLLEVGKIGTPAGVIPIMPAGTTFLLAGVHADPVSPDPKWRVTRDWRGSGPKGWSVTLYGSGSGGGQSS
jgi:hypothetical protein